jgi:hypothetical protein
MKDSNIWMLSYLAVRMTGFLDISYRPEFLIIRNTAFRKPNIFPSSGEKRETMEIIEVSSF